MRVLELKFVFLFNFVFFVIIFDFTKKGTLQRIRLDVFLFNPIPIILLICTKLTNIIYLAGDYVVWQTLKEGVKYSMKNACFRADAGDCFKLKIKTYTRQCFSLSN